MKIRAIGRRIHKYITGGTRFWYACRRWCPPGRNYLNSENPARELRRMNRLLKLGGRT